MTRIYTIANVQSGKHYVGSTTDIDKRWRKHRSQLQSGTHPNAHLQRAWNKYGENSFEFKIILQCSKRELIRKEQSIIDSYNFKRLYNFSPTAGSNFGLKHSPETKSKMSKAKRGNQNAKGHKQSPKQITERSKVNKDNQYCKGRTMSPETRAKISAANKGRSHSKVAKAKMSEAMKASWKRRTS